MKELKDYLHLYIGCEVLDLKKDETARLIAVVDRFKTRSAQVEYPEYTAFKYIEEIKPILRRIESMTQDEEREMHSLEKSFEDKVHLNIELYAAMTKWYCDKHFDLFGLIDASLAIDAATLTQTHNK